MSRALSTLLRRSGYGLILIIFFLTAFWGCTTSKGYQTSDVSYAYKANELAPRPEFVVHHINEVLTQVHYRINSQDLLYMRSSEDNRYRSDFSIRYELIPSFEDISILDSGYIHVEDISDSPPLKALVGKFDLNTDHGAMNRFVLRLVMTDNNRQVEFQNFIRIDKVSRLSANYFLLTDTIGNVIFKNHIATRTPFRLSYSGGRADKYYVSYYSRNFPVALPPYSSANDDSFELKPDTTFEVPAGQPLAFDDRGFYHFRIDTSGWDGFTVYSFYDEFPFIAKTWHLAPPLRYLTTKKEYDNLMELIDDPKKLKLAVDDFWLNRTGSVERSRVMVEAFYRRVQEANIYFSSYLEGWKSDRGIIYIVYGPPNKVYRSSAGESWIYGDENSSLSYYFNFVRVKNPFTDNDFALNRMPAYRYGWGQAIESWRNGHIYNSKDIEKEQNEQDQNWYHQRPTYWY